MNWLHHVLTALRGQAGAASAAPAPAPSDDDCFAALIHQLRAEGYPEDADRLHAVRYEIAWTTGTELLGELGLAILAFKRKRPRMSPTLRGHVKACLKIVRRAWPGWTFW